jgi:signal transduction histidine kinase
MDDIKKTKAQLIDELKVLRQQLKTIERSEQRAHDELGLRIQERTSELVRANEELEEEIAVRRSAEEKILRLNRTYSILSKINEAIVRIQDPGELYEQVCRIAVEDGLFKMAWIGLVDSETREVKPTASWGDTGGYLDTIKVIAADVPAGKGPTGRASFEGRYFICCDVQCDPSMMPWREKMLKHGFRSSGAFPLRIGPEVIGAFTLYADKAGYFTNEEIILLSQLAEDIALSVGAMKNEKRRLEAEEALRKLNEELEQKIAARTAELSIAYEDMASFSDSISHDLRAPLRIIQGFSQMLRADYSDKIDEEGRKRLNSIEDNAHRMNELIVALLDLSKVARKEMAVSAIDMDKLAKRAFDDLVHTLPGRTVKLDIKALPPARGDAVLIKQVFTNLISNAMKFTAQRQTPLIEIGSLREGNETIYYVRDNGAGFNMEYADKLFVAFQRLHTAGEFEGTGVGLSIVERIIRRHGGRVWAEGDVGKGATIYFSLG